jgi:hypothetical protein
MFASRKEDAPADAFTPTEELRAQPRLFRMTSWENFYRRLALEARERAAQQQTQLLRPRSKK